jgi:hypothetical protein
MTMLCAMAQVHASDWVEDEHDIEVQGQSAASFVRNDSMVEPAEYDAQAMPAAAVADNGSAVLADLADMEQKVFGQAFASEDLTKRLGDLEAALLGSVGGIASVEERIATLKEALLRSDVAMTQQELVQPAVKVKSKSANWFFNPPPIPMLDDMGHALKQVGKGVVAAPGVAANETGKLLTSPTVGNAILLGGLGVGAYFLFRGLEGHSNRGSAYPYGGAYGGFTNPDYNHVRGYMGKHGWVNPYERSAANGTMMDNWSTTGNFNPLTGKRGSKPAGW